MVSRILALLVWAAVAASAAYWGLRWFAKPTMAPPGTSAVSMNATPRGDIAKLLAGPAEAVAAVETQVQTLASALAARLQLIGVVAPRASGRGPGVALLVMDGKPAQAFRIGQRIEGDLVVQQITQQGVQIGPQGGDAVVSLSLPLLPPPATGVLPSATGMGSAAPANGMPPPSYQPPAPPPAGGMADTPVEGADAGQPSADTAEASSAPVMPRRIPSNRMRRRDAPSA